MKEQQTTSSSPTDETIDEELEKFFNGEKTLAEAQNIDPKVINFAAQQAGLFFEQGKLDEAEKIYRGLFWNSNASLQVDRGNFPGLYCLHDAYQP